MINLVLLCLFLGSTFLIVYSQVDTETCILPWECSLNLDLDAYHIYCYGESSCRESGSISADEDIECDGSYSCASSNKSIAAGSSGATRCHGYQSCINSQIQGSGNIDCFGLNSCGNTMIDGSISGNSLQCSGAASCANSTIIGVESVQGFGYYSLYGTIIYSGGVGDLTVGLTGYFAGYNLTVICHHNDTCTINCQDSGCAQTFIYCSDEISDHCNIICDNATSDCPIEMNLALLESNTNDSNSTSTGTSTGYNIFDLPSSLAVLDFSNAMEVPSCGESINDNGTITNTNPNVIDCSISEDSRCVGQRLANSGGSICCRGHQSCNNNGNYSTSGGRNHSIFCDGHESCYQSECNSNDGNIYCGGNRACNEANLTSNGTITCSGLSSCASSIINGGEELHCQGRSSCERAIITGVRTIYTDGYESTYRADIYSNGKNMNVYLRGHQSGTLTTIHCNSTDECYIRCESHDACVYTDIICDGQCLYYCNEPWNITCPSVTGTGYYRKETQFPTGTPTQAPSIAPSVAPTGLPSGHPSNAPTLAPSNSPSALPTAIPSTSPSAVPSITPTSTPTNIPSAAPTEAPTSSPTDNILKKEIWMYYKEDTDAVDEFSFSILTYANNLVNAVNEAFLMLLDDTLLDSVCDGNFSYYSDYCNVERRLLDSESSYFIDENGNIIWWQARIENLQFCVVLWDLEWNPQDCSDYDEDRFIQSDEYLNDKADKIAFGTFKIIADTNVDNFETYFENILNENNATLFKSIVENIMNDTYNSKDFTVVSVSIENQADAGEPNRGGSAFRDAAISTQFGLYGFIGFCALIAIFGQFHAHKVKSDTVKPIRIILFGIWTWDFLSDVLFAVRMYEQRFFIQFFASAVFVTVPWILSMAQLIRSERQWAKDDAIKHTIHRWLMKNNKKLISLTAICGSAYASIEMCNSRVFGMLQYVVCFGVFLFFQKVFLVV